MSDEEERAYIYEGEEESRGKSMAVNNKGAQRVSRTLVKFPFGAVGCYVTNCDWWMPGPARFRESHGGSEAGTTSASCAAAAISKGQSWETDVY